MVKNRTNVVRLDIIHSIMFHLPTVTGIEAGRAGDPADFETLINILTNEAAALRKAQTKMQLHIHNLLSGLTLLLASVLDRPSTSMELAGIIFFNSLEQFRTEFCASAPGTIADQHLARACYVSHQQSSTHGHRLREILCSTHLQYFTTL